MGTVGDMVQEGGLVPTRALTEAVHIGESDLPWVDIGDGSLLQLLQADLNE